MMLTIASLACVISGTVAICQVRSAPERTAGEQSQDEKIAALTARVDEMKSNEARFIHLEDNVKVHTDQLTEITWWARGIGFALILGVMERVFKIAVPKSAAPG